MPQTELTSGDLIANPATSSQQASWWSVHAYVTTQLDRVDHWPMIGSPEWCLLDDDDPRKIAAVYDAAQHWALRVETSQHAQTAASKDVAGAADWSAIARGIGRRGQFYEARPWLKRAAS